MVMSSFMTRWSVLQEHTVGPDDLGPDGEVTDAAVRRWIESACAAYLEQCRSLAERADREGADVQAEDGPLPTGADLGRPASVVVSASATEVFPDSFVLGVRLRPLDGHGRQVVNATRTIQVVDAAGTAREIDAVIRDELIALEHAAHHFN
jgi:hypothetical protein